MTSNELQDRYDVVVIGGGAAGLNGALMLARSLRSVVVIDAGEPRNGPAEEVHGLFAHDGTPPAELLERGRAEVRRYGGTVVAGEVVTAVGAGGGFTVTLVDGRSVEARRLLVTTGLVDELPDIEGLSERWGRDVVHCPYCHGWEVRHQAIGVVATGPMSTHQALLFRQLSDDVVFFAHHSPPDDLQLEQLRARGIEVVTGPVVGVEVTDDRLSGVRLDDGRVVAREAVAVATRMVARGGFLADLGLASVTHESALGDHVPTDPFGRTTVPGVWAAGNVTDLGAQVGSSAAAGAMAGAQINAELITEETDRAMALRR